MLNEIAGRDHTGTRSVGTPAVFGMNFQSVSTAQKLPTSDGLRGGYNVDGTPGPLLTKSLDYVNGELAVMLRAIANHGLSKSTTIILSAKHGQSPIDPKALRRIDDGAIIDAINTAWTATHPKTKQLVTFSLDDDGMLLWLSDRSPKAENFVKNYLLHHSAPANRITDPKGTFSAALSRSGLTKVYVGEAAKRLIGAKPSDPRVPDVIGIAQHGVVYTGKTSKIAEHGGAASDDLDVPLVVSGAGAGRHRLISIPVATKQIAPSILRLLGLDPLSLTAVRAERTRLLP